MEDMKVQMEYDGYIYSIKSVSENMDRKCALVCSLSERIGKDACSFILNCEKLGIECKQNLFSCIKIVVNVKNIGTNTDWIVGADDIMLIDSDGYSYQGIVLCEDILPFRISKNRTIILPSTQLDYIQLFPSLPKGVSISKFKVNIHHKWFDFIYSNETNCVEKISNPGTEMTNLGIPTTVSIKADDIRFELNCAKRDIKDLKTLIYSCLNNELTSTERQKLANTINNKIYSISLDLEDKAHSCFKDLQNELQEIENQFEKDIKQRKELEQQRRGIAQKIEDLLSLSPREFEEYVGQLYKSMGYKVEVTPYSNDKGIDVIMYKDDTKYVIQCKRYKGTVGSPDIQKFIGAIDHAKADKGIFVTTGMFSFEAEKMASDHPIILINRIDLGKLIMNALSNSVQ
ncbi:MAG: restriction endonuclease [Alloprevotella sp.]|nr:restriction endonuclease [Alloprevotella sp.]